MHYLWENEFKKWSSSRSSANWTHMSVLDIIRLFYYCSFMLAHHGHMCLFVYFTRIESTQQQHISHHNIIFFVSVERENETSLFLSTNQPTTFTFIWTTQKSIMYTSIWKHTYVMCNIMKWILWSQHNFSLLWMCDIMLCRFFIIHDVYALIICMFLFNINENIHNLPWWRW